ncbi:MAG: hypothetical protein KDD47_19335, partial [Acidobacteria bacterium]|nr:hypothetical protein [Acidobacteriota bacterium]
MKQISTLTRTLAIGVVLPAILACTGDDEVQAASSPAAASPSAAAASAPPADLFPMPQPDLDKLAPAVRLQIRERQLWQHRIDQSPESTIENRASAMGELGNLYHAYGFAAEAEICYRNAERLDPKNFLWPYYLCQVFGRTNKMDAAVEACRRAAELDEANVPVRVRLAELLAFRNLPDEARPVFEKAIARDDKTAAAHFGLAQLAVSRGDAAAAAKGFEKVLELQPDATAVHVLAAQAYRDLGDS